MVEWWATTAGLHAQVWRSLVRAAADRRSDTRLAVLSTIGAAGPRARTVVLRAAREAAAEVDVWTDLRSAKIAELRADPRGALTVWDRRRSLQIRLGAEIEILTGAAVADLWAGLPEVLRLDYGGGAAPGTPIEAPAPRPEAGDGACFAVLRGRVREIDAVHLGRDMHRRAVYVRADGWRGRWLRP